MDIMQLIEQKVSSLISKSNGTMSQADAYSTVFKDRDLYQLYRQASAHPEAHAEERTSAAKKAEAPSASGESALPMAVQYEVLRLAEKFSPEKPLTVGLEKLRKALQQARLQR